MLDDGQIAYEVRHAYRGGAALRIMTPMQFMARLAALIPPPRHPLIRFHGVFAPNSKRRSGVVPERGDEARAVAPPCAEASRAVEVSAHGREPLSAENARIGKERSAEVVERVAMVAKPLTRLDWATLLKRVHDVDALECPKCGGRMRCVEVTHVTRV